MKKSLAVLAAVAALSASPALAQAPAAGPLQVAPFAGAFLPILDQREVLDDAVVAGLMGSYDFHPNVAFVGSLAWSGTRSIGETVDLFQWDIGLQGQLPYALSSSWTLKPFLGVGVGTRTYDFRDLDAKTETDFVFYSSLGASLRRGGLDLGLTLRHQLTSFGPLGDSDARGDLGLFASAGWRF